MREPRSKGHRQPGKSGVCVCALQGGVQHNVNGCFAIERTH